MTQSKPLQVLVVDDERMYRDLLHRTLEADGFAVDTAADGNEAIDKINRQDYDIVVTDLAMPGVGGIEVLRTAKKKKASTVVIVITGYASLDTALTAIKDGVYDYITKPFQLEEIRLTLKNAGEKYSLARDNEELLAQLKQLQQKVEDLVANRRRHEDRIEEIDKQLTDRQQEITEGMRQLRGFHDRVVPAQFKSGLAEDKDKDKEGSPYTLLMDAIRLRQEKAISESEFQALKDKILKKQLP
jgi:DNA-binding response OmpR family regulator